MRPLQALFTFVLLASGAMLAATLRRIAARRAPPDAPQTACMAAATMLYALNAALQPRRPIAMLLVGGGILFAMAAVVLFLRQRPGRRPRR